MRLRPYPFEQYPAHVRTLANYAWKMPMVVDAARFRALAWTECAVGTRRRTHRLVNRRGAAGAWVERPAAELRARRRGA